MITRFSLAAIALTVATILLLHAADSTGAKEQQLSRHRNLGKAFYENPTTQMEAVEELRKALDLAPDSARDRLNYGLALLRAGKTSEGIAELEKVQKQAPKIPHTWFNLGIAFKRSGEYERAVEQFERMVQLVPDEPISHYNLGVLYRLTGKTELSIQKFETARRLDPHLAAARFQLYNAYRRMGRKEDAARELQVFQQIKQRQEGAAVPEDVEWSFYAELYEVIDPESSVDDSRAPELSFERRELAAAVDPKTAGLDVLDADGDGRSDLLVWSRNGISLFRSGTHAVTNSGLTDLKKVISVGPADYNNDGLTDLCVLTSSGPLLYVNHKGRFQKSAGQIGLPDERYEKAVWLDYDHDYDLDLFLLGSRSVLLQNRGEAGFADRTGAFPFVTGRAIDAATFRLMADSKGTELAVTYQDREGVLYRDKLAGKFEAVPMPTLPVGAKWVTASDIDNDSWTDLAFASGSSVTLVINKQGKLEPVRSPVSESGGIAWVDLENRGLVDLVAGIAVYRNRGLGQLASGRTPAGFPAGVRWSAADFDSDGRPDLAAVASNGKVYQLLNRTVTDNQWLSVKLAGIKNLKLSPGAEVEVKAGALYQKKMYRGLPLLFGLRGNQDVDTVRITWPNGLIQNEPKQVAGRAASYEEAQRLSGSCPMIFTWNGKEFQFITDVLGVAPLGASAEDGQYFPVDHDEYVQIPGEALALVKGRYEIRIAEELREVSYLDQVRLVAIDHPAGIDIFTNDKFKAPPFPEFRLFGVEQRIYPVVAHNSQGQDVLAHLLKRDRIYSEGFRRNYAGVAERHHLDLDFGCRAAPDNRAILILRGWVDWADGSTFLGAAQEGNGGLVLPFLQVKDARSQWRTVIEDMGIPAGKPKAIAVDLTGKFLSASREIRIVTNLCVYWDEIFLSQETAAPTVRLTEVDTVTADLHFRGFSKPVIHPQRRQPEAFLYAQVSPVSMWNPTPGFYARYGGVRELLEDVDDRLVIMGSGDEVRLLFDAAKLPALPDGWKRDFLLKVDGWAKDGDLNTAFSQSVEPLPFHGMSAYPYPEDERYPEDDIHQRYRQEYLTRPALRLIRPLTTTAGSVIH